MRRLREKSIHLTQFLQLLIDALVPDKVEVITPRKSDERGCQLSLRIKRSPGEARRCHERLSAAGVIGDWREPDILRLAPTPLYNSFSDVFTAVDTLSVAIRSEP
jgi:kynureninase